MKRRDPLERKDISEWNGEQIQPGETKTVHLNVSESHSGITIRVPVQIRRAVQPGPTVFVSAALHGDEINGTGAIRELIQDESLQLIRGNLILIPVLNILAFDRHSRYLPDRRDLNRCFPGSSGGSQASRMARKIFSEVVSRSDYGIDLHTAAKQRTNYPHIRADLSNPKIECIARAFGADIILNEKGPAGSFRRESCTAGCHTIVMEGGEVWKVESAIVAMSVRGIRNVLAELQMIEHDQSKPAHQIILGKTTWLRADHGGFLQFHVAPGEFVQKGHPIATNNSLLGVERNVIEAPFSAVVIGMTTLPSITPGEPICHLGKLPRGMKPSTLMNKLYNKPGLSGQLVQDLSTNVHVVDRPESDH